jgi:hypothetical protein
MTEESRPGQAARPVSDIRKATRALERPGRIRRSRPAVVLTGGVGDKVRVTGASGDAVLAAAGLPLLPWDDDHPDAGRLIWIRDANRVRRAAEGLGLPLRFGSFAPDGSVYLGPPPGDIR